MSLIKIELVDAQTGKRPNEYRHVVSDVDLKSKEIVRAELLQAIDIFLDGCPIEKVPQRSGQYPWGDERQVAINYGKTVEPDEYINNYGRYVIDFARNNGISIEEAYAHPTVKARFDVFSSTGY